jgi:hypothetical protein
MKTSQSKIINKQDFSLQQLHCHFNLQHIKQTKHYETVKIKMTESAYISHCQPVQLCLGLWTFWLTALKSAMHTEQRRAAAIAKNCQTQVMQPMSGPLTTTP